MKDKWEKVRHVWLLKKVEIYQKSVILPYKPVAVITYADTRDKVKIKELYQTLSVQRDTLVDVNDATHKALSSFMEQRKEWGEFDVGMGTVDEYEKIVWKGYGDKWKIYITDIFIPYVLPYIHSLDY